MMTRSLRGRLGLLVAAGALLITIAATTAITIARWHEENNGLVDAVELAAFQLSETTAPETPAVSLPVGSGAFAVVFDGDANVIGRSGDVPDGLLETVLVDLWSETTEQDVAVTYGFGNGGVASGVPCVDQAVCDSVVVGAEETPVVTYLAGHAAWLALPAILAALLGFAATRWLVGRSLRPVDEMREQLESITATDLDRRVDTPDTGDELERLGVALNDTIGRLGAALDANERFVADAAHELRSPIAGVRAALEVESSRDPDGLIDDSIAELDRAARLVDDLLLLSRRRAGTLHHHDVDLDDVVAREVAASRQRFPDVSIDAKIEPARVSGDADALRRVAANVIENACRYGNGRVLVTVTAADGSCTLRVDDDGPGIPPEHREIVFERFARLDESRSRTTGGSGLGLAIVDELVTAHGGTVSITGADAGGARVEVTLPRSGVADGQSS
jgi:signal transduction histidine kinase